MSGSSSAPVSGWCLTMPELHAAQFDEYRRTMAKLAEADCRRLGRDPDDLEVRVFSGRWPAA